jgi:hypothetical protein
MVNEVLIVLDRPASEVCIDATGNPGSVATLYTKLGGTLQRILLQPGKNRINLLDFKGQALVLKVETKYQTIVQELDIK